MPYHGKYEHPADILADESLESQEKIDLLIAWRDDKEAYIRASEEGMPGDDRADLLSKIEHALTKLGQPNPRAV